MEAIMSPRTVFEQQLEELHEEVNRMGMTVECNYDDLFSSIKSHDVRLFTGSRKAVTGYMRCSAI